jgi:O-antigen/teichoic acid export membrane protein
MKELGKWQIISFLSRGMAMFLGLVQSFVIIRILTVSEWGLIQLGVSIGGALGIYQHLGLASASTREISSAKDDDEIFKIFVTSILIRYLVTLPIAAGLFFFSRKIAVDFYNSEALILPLKIYAITILFQGFQGLLNSVIAGTKRFKRLFTYQVVIAAVSVVLYIPLVYLYRINGFFYALLSFNIVSTVVLGILSFKPLKGHIKLPSKHDLFRLFKDIFSISIAIYAVKIIYTNWEKLGSNVIGLFNTPDVVAIYAFALLFAKKLMNISDSVTDVNLPVLSEKFVQNIDEFKAIFKRNFDKVYTFILISAFVATFWSPELISILVGSQKYAQSYALIPPIIFAFIIYSIINIIKSSVFIPAKLVKEMFISFVLLVLGTGAFFYFGYRSLGVLTSMSWGMAVGALLSYVFAIFIIKQKLELEFFTQKHWLVLFQIFIFIFSAYSLEWWYIKIPVFIIYSGVFFWLLSITKLLTKDEVISTWLRIWSIYRSYVKRKK